MDCALSWVEVPFDKIRTQTRALIASVVGAEHVLVPVDDRAGHHTAPVGEKKHHELDCE
jgi:hypothetical protein